MRIVCEGSICEDIKNGMYVRKMFELQWGWCVKVVHTCICK